PYSDRAPRMAGLDGPGGLNDQIFNRLLRNRIVFLGAAVDDDIANTLCAQLLLLNAEDPEKDIWFYINSPGGSVTAGLAIYDTMQLISNDVATVALGKRFALPNAEILLHQGSAGLGGSASDIKIQAERLLRSKRRMIELTALHTGQQQAKIEKDSDRDHWFSAEDAKEYGLIDDIFTAAAHGPAGNPVTTS